MKTGIELMAEERETHPGRGWTPEHDDEHKHGEIARAACCYVQHSGYNWPWVSGAWHPAYSINSRGDIVRTNEDLIADYVKAGAFLAAEIDRLQRLQEAHNV